MELKVNQLVQNKRGDYGVVCGFNNTPALVVYNAYTNQPSRFNENLAVKGKDNEHPYNIVKVWDCKEDLFFKEVYKKSFKPEENNCTLIWESK